ncbi:diguanylate cyclase [uncultured Desulfobacter sp.]|uniref:diguanylate cyclase n=1 Tax=uncultured Desulfobacter sp. TaxID=240139 RepID=UPI002AAA83F2|nr:diguanylate cyclase [uncultured Desulfobacter sp.]
MLNNALTRLQILQVEDNPGDARLIKETLLEAESFPHRLYQVGTLAAALETITAYPMDVVLLDLGLPDTHGLESVYKICAAAPDLPVVVLTGLDDKTKALEAVQAGVQDYLVKGFLDPELLARTIRYAIERKRWTRDLYERNQELEAIFHLSSLLTTTLDREKLFPGILDILTTQAKLEIQKQCGMFLIEGESLVLAAHRGLSDSFAAGHTNMTIHDCLCGQTARSGKLLISENCQSDLLHTIHLPGETPHGHIIVPLIGSQGVVGVLFLYTAAGYRLKEEKLRMLRTAGSLMGMAIENVRRFEEATLRSNTDALTGLANRRYLDFFLEKSVATARRYNRPLSALMIDIDFFKKYNDTFGHPAGDKLLKKVADIISSQIRTMDMAARFGGEEFFVLLPETDADGALNIAERIRLAIAEQTEVTISLGTAVYQQKSDRSDGLIKRADTALYRAKQNGRNRVEMAER